ncbi:DUF4136 domain-containing protein [Salegentibacter salegens]|uniref:DUF4136 domain-containing protein n=1 Tax=Salegentibacter salegens TaxID=143223 RepID=A0A1M7HUD3_9FLAO|nr:DUF4136 domain-containing protein [Salegentibacter salegens]PRX40192.1 uncharacterized protein DUF4136 [Salegentibacter salegens]SHM32126.1 protein of unknown function [Salegentibacter salegens]
MKLIKLLFVFAIISSCNTPKAVYDYDDTVSFNNYKTYQLFPDFQSGLSQLDETRLIASLKNGMENEGFSTSEEPGVYVNVYSREFMDQNRSSIGVGIGGGGRSGGVGVSGGIPIENNSVILEVTIDFIDVTEDSLIWQAVVESKFNPNSSPEKRRVMFDKMVQKALEGYPPKK